MRHQFVELLHPWRLLLLITFDAVVWVLSVYVFTVLRYDIADVTHVPWRQALTLGMAAAAIHLSLGWPVRLHHGRAAVGSLDEMVLLGMVTAGTTVGLLIVDAVTRFWLPLTVPLAAGPTALVVMAGARASYRRVRERSPETMPTWDKVPVLIVGAGEGAQQLIASIARERGCRWRPLGLVDDDPLKRHRRLRGVPVLGSTEQMVEVAERIGAATVIVAIPSATAEFLRRLSTSARAAGLAVKVVPSTNDLLAQSVGVSDIRDIDITDLLGRHQIDTDLSTIARYLNGKRVLVTGAGGSIGSELCRQIHQFGPAELMMLDRDESALHMVELSIHGKAMLDTDETVLGDIRDTQFILDLFERRRPQVVFHAAALKHLPLLEQAPGEAIKTNVWGTLTVLEAAAKVGVEKFVNISTDKAANPCSVLGYSKRLAEGLTASIANDTEGTYLSVRFGNVLGSRGSVLTAFASQIARGGPVTVTDPGVTRYFMTIQEAVQLVIQAAAIGRDGEALVLDMGQPVSIDSVARQLIRLSGEKVDVVYTGLRAGEKMHEDLLADGEPDERPHHDLICHTPVPGFDPVDARGLDPWSDRRKIHLDMRKHCAAMAREMVNA